MDVTLQLEMLLKVAVAAVFAGFVGLEREKAEKPAGLRTHMIIGSAAALLVSLGQVLVMHYEDLHIAPYLQTDPIRIIEAIIVGISFIGAGTILKREGVNDVRFLTTAASILMSAGIGIAVALDQYVIAAGVTILSLIINYTMLPLDNWLSRKFKEQKQDRDKLH